MSIDREHAAAMLGAESGEPLYALDERARTIRDRIRPELAESIQTRRGLIVHRVSSPSLLPVIVRRHRLRADGVVELIGGPDPERAAIARLSQALRRRVLEGIDG